MKVRTLLNTAFATIFIGIVAICTLVILFNRVNHRLDEANVGQYLSYQIADEFRQTSMDLTEAARVYVATRDEKYKENYWALVDWQAGDAPRPDHVHADLYPGQMKSQIDIMKELNFTPSEFAFLQQAAQNSNDLIATEDQAMRTIDAGEFADGPKTMLEGESPQEFALRIMFDQDYHNDVISIMKPVNRFFDEMTARTAETVRRHKTNSWRLLTVIITLSGLMFLVSLSMGIYVTRRVQNLLGEDPAVINSIISRISVGDLELDIRSGSKTGVYQAIEEMVAALRSKAKTIDHMAGGDFSGDITTSGADDGLGNSLVQMQVSLNDMLSRAGTAAEQVNLGSGQVSQASQSLSDGATEQAGALEEVSATATEINDQARQNAVNARDANALALEASQNARTGNDRMSDLTTAMTEINSSSGEIRKVVKVIDDIAFQINLLALNANVEAARAGKFGKGFAVVAEEVRTLATRSAEAVRETTSMVDASISSIEQGNDAVGQTAEQLKLITDGAEKVAELLAEIASASDHQANGINQLTSGLEQIDQVTQSNTATAEECAAASEELASQAVHLTEMLKGFRLKGHMNQPTPTAGSGNPPMLPAGTGEKAAPVDFGRY